ARPSEYLRSYHLLVGTGWKPILRERAARKKIRASLRKPGAPNILSGPVHPFGSLAALSVPPSGRLRAHSFASPPHDGFALVEEEGLSFVRGAGPGSMPVTLLP